MPELQTTELSSQGYVAPRTEVEQSLAAIWQELLAVEQVGIHDNFFELGGHSLLGMQMIAAVKDELQIELLVQNLFRYTTIAELGKYIEVRLMQRESSSEKAKEGTAEYEEFVI